jgi:hypothetical protein
MKRDGRATRHAATGGTVVRSTRWFLKVFKPFAVFSPEISCKPSVLLVSTNLFFYIVLYNSNTMRLYNAEVYSLLIYTLGGWGIFRQRSPEHERFFNLHVQAF